MVACLYAVVNDALHRCEKVVAEDVVNPYVESSTMVGDAQSVAGFAVAVGEILAYGTA